MSTTTLLLNATYEPLHVISWQRAVVLVMAGKADVLEEADEPLRAESFEMNAPRVIRLRYVVKVPYRAKLRLSREALIARDHGNCAYCKAKGDTIDHVHPRAKGGENIWENVVLACKACNNKKGDKTLADLGWKLAFKPYAPKGQLAIGFGRVVADPSWQPYLAVA